MIQRAILKLFKRVSEHFSQLLPEDSRNVPENSKREIELVIGLDFGTSFSKVVAGGIGKHYAVPFNDYSTGENSLLLPSALCELPDNGKCELGIEPRGGNLYDNLKMPLIEGNFSDETKIRAVAFLALVLRHTRNWLLSEHGLTFQKRKINWFVNIGLPTDSYENKRLESVYRTIAHAAWKISVLPSDVTLARAREVLQLDSQNANRLQEETAVPDRQLADDRINVFPEFAAQLAGYVRSPRRRKGLHVTVDVGGGTLDITVFNVHKRDDDDYYPILDRRVEPLGVRYLIDARLRQLRQDAPQVYSPFDNLPSDADFAKKFGITGDQIESADKPFLKCVRKAIGETLLHTKKCRAGYAPQWDRASSRYGEHVPGFFCGGGVLADFYTEWLHQYEEKRPPFRLQASELPVPDNLEVPEEAPAMTLKSFARLAVAYGLSFDPFNIGKVKPTDEIVNIPPDPESPQSAWEDRYLGKEQV